VPERRPIAALWPWQVYDVAGKPRLDLQRPFPENRSDKRDFVLTREQLATALAAGQKRIHA